MLVWVGRFLTNNHFCRKQPFRSWLTFLYFKCFLIATLHIFVGRHLHKLLTLKVLYLLDQALSFILSRWPDQCILLFWKYSLMRFMLSLIFISSLVETLSQIYHCSSIWLFLHHSFLAWCHFFLISFSSLVLSILCTELIPCISAQPAIACLKLIIETLEQGVKYIQS